MPCDTITLNRVALAAMEPKLADAALAAIGATNVNRLADRTTFYRLGGWYTMRDGKLEGPASLVGAVADKLRAAYGVQVMRLAAARTGGQVVQTGPNTYNVVLGR